MDSKKLMKSDEEIEFFSKRIQELLNVSIISSNSVPDGTIYFIYDYTYETPPVKFININLLNENNQEDPHAGQIWNEYNQEWVWL